MKQSPRITTSELMVETRRVEREAGVDVDALFGPRRGRSLADHQRKIKRKRKYRGIYYSRDIKRKRPWVAAIGFRGRTVFLGTFETEIGAAKAYDEAAYKMWGDEAMLNFPRKTTNE